MTTSLWLKPFNALWQFIKVLLAAILFFSLVLLCLMMFFVGPIAIVVESFEMWCMDSQTLGTLKDLAIVRGGRGTSAVHVTYDFTVDGELLESTRLYPGFMGNYGTSTNGDALADSYQVGNQYPVYYDSANPSRVCLEYGWPKWSIGWTAFIWGMIGTIVSKNKKSRLWLVPLSLMLYGIALIAVGPHTVRPHELPWHLLALPTLGMLAALARMLPIWKSDESIECEVHAA